MAFRAIHWPTPPTNTIATAGAVIRASQQVEADTRKLLKRAEVDPELLDTPGGRIPGERMIGLWHSAYSVVDDDDLALHAAENLPFGSYPVLDYIVRSAPTFGVGFERFAHFLPLVNEWAVLTVTGGEKEWDLDLASRLGPMPRAVAQFGLGTIVVRSRVAWGIDWQPLRVHLTYPKPASTREHDRIFRCPIHYNSERNSVVVGRRFWESSPPSAEPVLWSTLNDHARNLLAQHQPRRDLAETVASLLPERLAPRLCRPELLYPRLQRLDRVDAGTLSGADGSGLTGRDLSNAEPRF